MNDLVEKIRQNCAGAYFAAEYYANLLTDPSEYRRKMFTCNPRDSDLLFALCGFPEAHYLRWNPFLPKDFRRIMHDKNGQEQLVDGTSNLDGYTFFIFHYKVNLRSVARGIKSVEECNQTWKEMARTGMVDGREVCAKSWLAHFKEKFHPATVFMPYCRLIDREYIYDARQYRCNEPHIVGRQSINQEVINFMKSSKDNVFEIFSELLGKETVEQIKNQKKQICIYDLVSHPKEVRFDIS